MNDPKVDANPDTKSTSNSSAPAGKDRPSFPLKRAVLIGGAFVSVSLLTWVVVVAIQRSQDEPTIDPSEISNVEISHADPVGDGEDPFSSWKLEDGSIKPDAPFAIQYLHDHPPAETDHVLDPLLGLARESLIRMRQDVQDYSATIIKHERIGNRLDDENYMEAKIRQPFPPKTSIVKAPAPSNDPPAPRPFAVYLRFLEPASTRGREVIWVEGENDNKLIAHEGGLKNLLTVKLAPESSLAMLGNRYPITEIGLENLLVRFVEIGERIKDAGECNVTLNHHVTVDDRPCTLIELKQIRKKDDQDFFRSEVYIDHQTSLPIRYLAYDWPETEGGEPLLIESYTYKNLKINVGLTEADYDPKNEAYRYH